MPSSIDTLSNPHCYQFLNDVDSLAAKPAPHSANGMIWLPSTNLLGVVDDDVHLIVKGAVEQRWRCRHGAY